MMEGQWDDGGTAKPRRDSGMMEGQWDDGGTVG